MAKSVNIPDVGTVNFPDGMDDDAITRAIENEIIPHARSQADARRAAEPSTIRQTASAIGNSLGLGSAELASGAGQIIQAPRASLASGIAAIGAIGASSQNGNYAQPESDPMGSQTGAYEHQAPSEETISARDAAMQRAQQASGAALREREAAIKDGTAWGRAGGVVEDAGDTAQAFYKDSLRTGAPMLGRQQQAIQNADGFVDTSKEVFTNPLGAVGSFAEALPGMAIGAGAGSLAAKGVSMAMRGAATKAAEAAWQQTLLKSAANPATFAEANSLARTASQEAYKDVISAHAAEAAGAVSNAAEGFQSGMQNSAQIKTILGQRKEDGTYAISDADLTKNSPRFAQLIAEGSTPDRARTLLGAEQGDQAALGGLWTMAAGKLSGAAEAEGKLLTRTGRPTISTTLRNAGKEGLEEAMQGPGEDLASFQAQKEFDPNAKYDLGGSIAQNLWAGLAMGGGMHGGGHALSRLHPGEPEVRLAGRPVSGYTNEDLQGYAKSGILTGPVQAKVDAELQRRAIESEAPNSAPGAELAAPGDDLDTALKKFADQAGINGEAAAPAAPVASPADPAADPVASAAAPAPAAPTTQGDVIPSPVSTQGTLDELEKQAAAARAAAADAIRQEQDQREAPAPPRQPPGQPNPLDNIAAAYAVQQRTGARLAIADHGGSATSGVSHLESARTRNDVSLEVGRQSLARSGGGPDLQPIQDRALFGRANVVADAIHSITGAKPVLFHDPSPHAPDGFELNGVSYLNAGNLERSLQFTAFHETFHVAETRAKAGDASAQQFVKTAESIFDMIDDKGKREYAQSYLFSREAENGSMTVEQMLSSPKLKSEMVADFFGKRGDDIKFMRNLAQRSPEHFGGFARRWIDSLTNFIAELRGKKAGYGAKDIDQYIQKLSHAKAVATSALIEWRNTNPRFAQNLPAAGKTLPPANARQATNFMSPTMAGAVDRFRAKTKPRWTSLQLDERAAAQAKIAPQLQAAEQSKPEFDRKLGNIATQAGGAAVTVPVKGVQRAVQRMLVDHGGDPALARDLVRGTVIVPTLADVPKAMKAVAANYPVVRMKDRFSTPTEDGYRDVVMNVQTQNGLTGEIQIHTPETHAARVAGHPLYTEARNLEAAGDTSSQVDEVRGLQQQLHDEAHKATLAIEAGKPNEGLPKPEVKRQPVKLYRTREGAAKARKDAGNTQRMLKVKGGFILRQATDKEMAAAQTSGRRLARDKMVDPANDPLLTAIAKMGGLAMTERSDTIGQGNKNVGGKMLFTNAGFPIDTMAEYLSEHHFIPPDEMARDGGTRWLRDAVAAEFMGNKIHHSLAAEDWMEEAQRRAEMAMDDEFDPFAMTDPLAEFSVDELGESTYTGASAETQALTEKMLAEAEALGLDVDSIKENADSATRGQSDDYFHAEAQRLAQAAIAGAGRISSGSDTEAASGRDQDHGQAAGDQSQEDASQGLTLESQSVEDLKAKTEREASAVNTERAKKAAEQAKLAKDAEARDNKARADQTVDDFQLGQSADRQMTGMDDMFSGPDVPFSAKQTYKEVDEKLKRFLASEPDRSQAGPAVEAARTVAAGAVRDLHAIPSVLSRALSGDLATGARTSLVGQVARTAHDFAALAQVYRDQRFETFRYVFTDANRRVVSQVGLTSRLPGSAAAGIGDIGRFLKELQVAAKASGATGVYLLHNHPSGIATPSEADLRLTKILADNLQDLAFMGHVVIDTNEYSVIDRHGESKRFEKDFGAAAPFTSAGDWSNFALNSPADAMRLARGLAADPGAVTLVVANYQHRVLSITSVPSAAFSSNAATSRRLLARAAMRAAGAKVIAVSHDLAPLEHLSTLGLVLDSLHLTPDGQVRSLAEDGRPSGGSPFKDRATRVTADTSQAFEYLRQQTAAEAAQNRSAAARQAMESEVPRYSAKQDRLRQESPGSAVHTYASPVAGVKTFMVVPEAAGRIEILDFEVQHKRSGVGRQAIEEFAGWAANNGFSRVRADATSSSIPFWAAAGFTDTGRKDGKLSIMRRDISGLARADGGRGSISESAKQIDTPEFKRWFGNSSVVDADGKPLVVYHGTKADFYIFDTKSITNISEGPGFYFTNNKSLSKGYGKVIKTYLSLKKPLDYAGKPFSKATTEKILQVAAYAERGDRDIADGFLSNYGDIRSEGITAVLRAAAGSLAENETAVDQLSDLFHAGVPANIIFAAVKKVTGHDGIVANGFSNEGRGNSRIYVAWFPEQIKSATGNNGAFDPINPDIRRSSKQEPFYSALSREVAKSPMNAGLAGAWGQYLDALAKRGAIKADEVEWSGLRDFLALQPGKITKAQVSEFLAGNGVRVTEATLSNMQAWTAEDSDRLDELENNDERTDAEDAERQRLISLENAATGDGDSAPVGLPKYGDRVLPGGTNYRELLLTLPEKPPSLDDAAKSLFGLTYGELFPGQKEDARRLAGSGKMKNREGNYQSPHWDQTGVLAHVRLNDRIDSTGAKVLFVEELQSDHSADYRKAKDAIGKAVDNDFAGIIERMKMTGVLEVNCD